ncbi:uncharacterized protein MICPUCDRAFT_49115 [Micromonas pusilla CCMP1545]|uniref:Predicted protein n=1 Tax=Micromonas pusilla (strain CCMP1545) TaxID=564608 RepID=C1N889_MICPC|nr:uncharacterized protein MICPUCDRAFT_49115 [Micromonas pusilla CCMP1545]EEH51662.1 predicted protein [Micromonas pusilla CCMP1545]|eukprot:XP_003064040.1 predicted protein [Micromonas pusilla CCMP1545]
MPVHAQLNGLYTAPADPTEIRTFRPVGSHLGDKTSEWWLARDQDVFVLMHNALRGEVTKLESVLFTLGDKTLKEWEIQAIRDHWTGHYESLKEHFKIEDEIMHPFVKTRVDILGDAFRESHEELAELAHAVDRTINNHTWATAKELSPSLHAYRTALWPHFIEEENIVIPLTRAYFTQKEVGDAFGTVLRTKKSSAARRLVLGSIVHHLAGGKEGTMTFLARCGFERFAWYQGWRKLRAHYRARMESKLESLLQGEELVCKHKAEMTHLRRLKSLPISERIVRRPSASVTLSMDLRNEMLFNKVDAPSARPETPPPVAKLAKNRRGSMDSNEGSVGRVKRAMEDVERSRGKMDARVEVAAK